MRKRPVVAAFERHYRRIRGELESIATEIVAAGVAGPVLATRRAPEVEQRHAALRAIELCLGLEEKGWTPDHLDAVKTKRRSTRDHGQILHIAYDILREAEGPIRTSEILERLWLAGRLTYEDTRDRKLHSSLTTSLRGQERAGAVVSWGVRPLKWSIRRAPGQFPAADVA